MPEERDPKVELAVLVEKMQSVDDRTKDILEQTKLTNGRVDKLESWRDRIVGGMFVLSLAVPVVTAFLVDKLTGK